MLPVMKRAASWKTSTLHGDAVIRQRRIHPAPATSRMIISRSSPPIRVKERRKRKIFSSTIKVFCSTTSGTCAIVWGRRVPDVTSDVPNVSPPNAATSAGTTGGGSMTSSRWTETRGLSGKTNSKQSQTTVLDTSGQLNDTWCEQLVETNIIFAELPEWSPFRRKVSIETILQKLVPIWSLFAPKSLFLNFWDQTTHQKPHKSCWMQLSSMLKRGNSVSIQSITRSLCQKKSLNSK